MNFRSCVGSFIQLIQLLFITDWGLEGTFISKNPAHWPSLAWISRVCFSAPRPARQEIVVLAPEALASCLIIIMMAIMIVMDVRLSRWWSRWPLLVPETPVPSPIKDLDQRSYSVPAVELLGSWQQWIVFIGSICRAVEKIGDPGLRRLPIFSRPRYSRFTPVVTPVFTPVVTLLDPLVTLNRIPQ